jgi:hypothetical protein
MSNGSPLAEELRQGDDPGKQARSKSALAESLRTEILGGPKPTETPDLAGELRGSLKRIGPKPPEPPPGLVETLVHGLITEPLKDISVAARLALIGGMGPDAAARVGKYLSEQHTNDANEMSQRALRGAAFLYSFAGGPAVGEALPAVSGPLTAGASRFLTPGPLLGKWGSFLVGEMLGGGIYGAVRPTDDDESRASAILGDASVFAAFSSGVKGATEVVLPWALKRAILRMPDAKRRIALGMAKAGLDRAESDLAHGGVTLDQLPPEAAAKIEEPILREAIHTADPSIVDLDAVVRQEVDRELETNAKLMPEKAEIKGLQPPAEVAFKDALEKTPREMTDEELATQPLGKTPPLAESAAGREYQPRVERRKVEHPVDIERRRTPQQFTPGGTSPAPGTVEVMKKAIDISGGRDQFQKLVESKAKEQGRSIDATLIEETARNLVQETQSRAQLNEHVIGPVVKGKSGKVYIGGATHQETIDLAVRSGVPKSEFAGATSDSPRRGFKTNARDFVSREDAAKLVGHDEPLISEDMHKRGVTPLESPRVAEMAMEDLAMKASKDTPPEAAMDAALDHAVASTKPLDTAAPSVKDDAKLVTEELHPLPTHGAKEADRLQGIIAAALDREGPATEKAVLVGLTDPTPREINIEKIKARTPHEQNRNREALERSLAKEKAPIEVEPTEQASVPWTEKGGEGEAVVPKALNGPELAVRMNDAELDALSKAIIQKARGTAGFVSGRLLILATGSGMEWLGYSDNNLTPGESASLKMVGGLLIAASLGPRIAEWAKKSQYVRKMLTAYNPALMMNDFPKGKEFFRQYVEMLTGARAMAHSHAEMIRKVFPDAASMRAAMFVLDEGPNAPEWNMLTPAQQQEAMALHQFNLRLGLIGKGAGILDDYRENYVRHLLPPETFDQWKTTGFRVLPTSGAFAKERIFSLRELEEFAAKRGLPPPIMDLATVHSYHLGEFHRALAGVKLKDALEGIGLITDAPKSAMTALPTGWRPIGVLNLRGKIAPDVVAKTLENISAPRTSSSEIVNSLDRIKGLWMRGIMFWFWEHGFNAMRSLVNLSMNPMDYPNVYRYMRDTEAIGDQGARYGLNLYDRPDYGADAKRAAELTLGKVGIGKHTLAPLGARFDKILGMQDRLLWDKMIPFLQKFTYATEMYRWTERTGGKFLEGSPEFTTQARRAADYANTIAGRVPRYLQDPELARGMRLLMFSPQWTMSRISIIAQAAGEASEIMAGRLNPKDSMYLPFKMQQVALGAMLTFVGSKILSNKSPTFNPSSSKFYMRTGLHNSDGKEIGLDVIGWWQDDLRLFNHPFDFVANRMNPAFKVAYETITGRDYLGRSMTPSQRIGNIVTSFGPIPEIASDAVRLGQAAAGGRPVRGAEGLQMASRATATFRTSVLPKPIDVALAKYAKKLLVKQGVPANDDNVFELSRLMRANFIEGKDLIDPRVVTFLAYRRRGEIIKHPVATPLWAETRRVIADF